MDCPCKPEFSENIQVPSDLQPTNQQTQISKKIISKLKFEPTLPGTKVKKIFQIKNEETETLTYSVQRDPTSNPIYHVFDFKVTNRKVPSNEYLECTVTYHPQIPNTRNIDYFQLTDNKMKVHEVYLEGKSIGPVVNFSIKCLYFYNTKTNQSTTKTFELQNTSDVEAIFQFDVNEQQTDMCMFKMNKARGTIAPHSHAFIKVTFSYSRIGIYSRTLFCKILYHPPIQIQLVGALTKNLEFDLSNQQLRRHRLLKGENINGYENYMHDCVKTTTEIPSASLSTNFFDFGHVKCRENGEGYSVMTTCLTNHTPNAIEVNWHNSSEGIFTVTPEVAQIPHGESVLYECRFQPDKSDQLYTSIISACVNWTNLKTTTKEVAFHEIIDTSLNVSIRLLGNSFSDTHVWLPRVEIIPNVVVLPPAIPTTPTYTTFMLQNAGQFPSSFKFVPPKKSNFILKPMLGIIYDYQIILAQLQPDANDKKAYIELWGVEYNGRIKDSVPFYLKGYSEYATITIGDNNVVVFQTVHPGCQDISTVAIKNPTAHFIQYNFLLPENSNIEVEHPKGYLASNGMDYVKWYLTGDLQAPEVFTVHCEVQTVQDLKVTTGLPLDVFVTVYSKCSFSQLCSTPNHHDFGEIEWNTTHTTIFHLFNFCESPIHFKLIPKDTEVDSEHLMIVPTQATVNPKEKFQIMVHLKPTNTGLQKNQIMYQIRLNKDTNVVINDGERFEIFSLEFKAVYPTLQVTNISKSDFGFLFGKLVLWEMFNITELNKALREIERDEIRDVQMFLPEYEMGDEGFFATLVVRNVTQFPTQMSIKREKICDCKLVTQSVGLSFRKKIYECIHREMFRMDLSDEEFQIDSSQRLKMGVKYTERGLTRMLYNVTLSHNRTIKLYVNITVLPAIVTIASKYSACYKLNFRDTFIGEKQPPAEALWLYNNSSFVIKYELDTTPLSVINYEYGFEIFKSLNPTGEILPFSVAYLFFSFVPITYESYHVTVPLKMGEEEFQFELTGRGVASLTSNMMEDLNFTMPLFFKKEYTENVIEISRERLIIESLTTWSVKEEMIFIRNLSLDRIIGYSWETCAVEGILSVSAACRKGILQPKESRAIIMVINSFDQPCRLHLQVTCKLLDHSQHIQHEESILAYNYNQAQLEGQFTITEEGAFYPKNDIVIVPPAQNFYINLAISVCVTSSLDRDLYMDTEKQMEQSPQYHLKVNVEEICKKYFNKIYRKAPFTFESKDNHSEQPQVIPNKKNLSLYQTIIECLIADVLWSDLFYNILKNSNNIPQPYYIQFKMDSKEDSSKDANEKQIEELSQRVELIECFFNQPQPSFIADILKELIVDGIHEAFQLGPPFK